MRAPLYPLLLRPSLHAKVWGGRRLAQQLGKALPTDEPYGESWEMHDSATVANGPLEGRTLAQLVREYGAELIGPDNNPADGFPLLAKFLDANAWLSVQVHPNDDQARAFQDGECGKTEAWYVVDAAPDSCLIFGVCPGTTRDELRSAIAENRLEPLLRYVPVRRGDTFFVAAGTIHALGPGILVYEIQQSSDLTYRFYDWGRVGLDGKPRALHVDKSLAVASLDEAPAVIHTGHRQDPVLDLIRCEYFRTELHQFTAGGTLAFQDNRDRRNFESLTCIEGSAVLEADGTEIQLQLGSTALVPASIPGYTLRGRARVLRSLQTLP